ncbi:MAG: 3-deoxy-D-manno-octulosonate 8-phosphate phosphatase [Mucinivorans sp.]
MDKNFKEILTDIRAFVFDVDGVFTNGQISIDADGNMLRSYNVKDGLAVVYALKKGYQIAIISGGKGAQLENRMRSLGIDHLYLQKDSKSESLLHFSQDVALPLSQMLYMGDDYPDLAPMSMVRLAVAPFDAADVVRQNAHYTSSFKGGQGCVRDIIEQVLRSQGDWFDDQLE